MTLRDRSLSASNTKKASGIYRATVTAVSTETISVKIPRLSGNIEYSDVSFYGDKPSVNDEIIVGFLEGNTGIPVALVLTGEASTLTGGGGSSVGGANTQVQYNNSGVLAGSANMTFDGTSLNVAGLKLASTAITSTAAELNILDGVTSTTAELNILDGVTSTTAELNILDGVTSTTAELNILDGVTSTAAELNILDGVTSTAAELNILDGVTSTTAELNILDGVTSTTAELNILDGVIATNAELNTVADITLGTVTANKAVSADSNSNVSSAGQFTAYSGGADGGIVLGRAYGGYVGLRTAGMAEDSGDEYVIMSNGVTTFISAGGGSGNDEGDVHIRAGGNSTSCQIHLDTSADEINIDGELKTDDPITSTDLISTTSVIQANEFRASDYGPASDSSFTFVSDENLGMYRVSADSLGLSANGLKFEVQNTQILWHADLPVVSGYSTLRRKSSNNVVGYDGSSIRYKENVTNFVKSDWEKIYNLQAVRFNWKKEIDEDQNRSWGFISEDVYAQIPELGVMRVVQGVNDGNPVPDTVNYEQMCVFLVEAVKDLNARLAALE
jgi:hypothetical protein